MAPRRRLKKHRISGFQKEWNTLYNRLQAGDDEGVEYVMRFVAHRLGFPYTLPLLFIEQLMARFSVKITTMQMNYPKHISYTVSINWINYAAKPLYGYYYPRNESISSSPRLIHAILMAYLQLSRQAGKFVCNNGR